MFSTNRVVQNALNRKALNASLEPSKYMYTLNVESMIKHGGVKDVTVGSLGNDEIRITIHSDSDLIKEGGMAKVKGHVLPIIKDVLDRLYRREDFCVHAKAVRFTEKPGKVSSDIYVDFNGSPWI